MQKRQAEEMNVPLEELPGKKAGFEAHQLNASVPFLKAFILLVGFFNLILLIPDLFFVNHAPSETTIIILRGMFLAALLVIFFRIKEIGTYKIMTVVISLVELFAVTIFLFVLSRYDTPDFMIQLIGVVIIIIAVFLVPNRWMYMLAISLLAAGGFLAYALLNIPGLDTNHFAVGAVYLAVAISLCSAFAYYSHSHQFGEYIAKEELKRVNAIDQLTQLANRTKLIEEAGKWMDFSVRHGLPISLIIIDIDNLKKVNDQYGHLAGDAIIAGVAGLMRGLLRQEDVMARWGGDEFIILLPYTHPDEAETLSERLRAAVERHTFLNGITATCSFGVADMKKGTTLEALISRADKSLYRAKRLGKNRVQMKA